MNLMLLPPNAFNDTMNITVEGRQFEHLKNIIQVGVGNRIRIGEIGGNKGIATITNISTEQITLCVQQMEEEPPPILPINLIVALPRPQMIKRILQTISTLGVTNLHFIHTQKVEKSFWQSPVLRDASINEQLLLGAEQASSTHLPKVYLHKNYKQFMQNALDEFISEKHNYIAHIGENPEPKKLNMTEKSTFIIGPEGGFIEKEVEHFLSKGFQPVSLGKRILRVETAVTVSLAKMY